VSILTKYPSSAHKPECIRDRQTEALRRSFDPFPTPFDLRDEVFRAEHVVAKLAKVRNFGVVDVNENETWVIVTEWMQRFGPDYIMPVDNKYGADNSVYVSKILWKRPNRLMK